MRGVGQGRDRDRHEDVDQTGGERSPETGTVPPDRPGHPHPARGGYLGGDYPASPPPAEAPASGPDPQSADPYYQRPEYPTDPGGIALPDLSGEAEDAEDSPGQ